MGGQIDDEEITSESEEEDEEDQSAKQNGKPVKEKLDGGDASHKDEDEDDEGSKDEDMISDEVEEAAGISRDGIREEQDGDKSTERAQLKRKIDVESVEETLAKRHTEFQNFRWDDHFLQF